MIRKPQGQIPNSELALGPFGVSICVCVSIEEASVKGSFLVAFVAVLEGCVRALTH